MQSNTGDEMRLSNSKMLRQAFGIDVWLHDEGLDDGRLQCRNMPIMVLRSSVADSISLSVHGKDL
jgi:hypothetical protein